jgi:hypothetical protein
MSDPIFVRPSEYLTSLLNALEPYFEDELQEPLPDEETLEKEGWGKRLRERLKGASGEAFGFVLGEVAEEYKIARAVKSSASQ